MPIVSTRIHWAHLSLLLFLPLWMTWSAALPDGVRLFGWLVVAATWLGLAERVCPFRDDWTPDSRALRRDGSVLALNVVVDGALTMLLAVTVLAIEVPATSLPLAAQFLLGLGAGELGSYAIHRASHREGWLWRTHLLHHLPTRLNLANALTVHPFNAIYEKLARVLPLGMLGLSPDAILSVTLFVVTQNLVAHANVAGTIGPLNYVIGSAELHRLHHSTIEAEARNFGTAVPWWDLMLGTYQRPSRAPGAVGVFDPSRYPGELELMRLLMWPVRVSTRAWRCCS